MGIYYRDQTDPDYAREIREHKENLIKIAEEIQAISKASDKSLYPEFLWEPLSNSFEGDDYIIRGSCTNDNVLRAYTIGRKYSDFNAYLDALDIYDEYVSYIESVYGPFTNIKKAYDDGNYIVYIPKKPKLSNKKANKEMLRAGFRPSRIYPEDAYTADEMRILANSLPEMELLEDEEDEELTEEEAKAKKEVTEAYKVEERIRNIYKIDASKESIAATNSVIHMLNGGFIENKDAYDDSLSASIINIHCLYGYTPDMKEYKLTIDGTTTRDGIFFKKSVSDHMDVIEALVANGHLHLSDVNTSSLDGRTVRAIKHKYEKKPKDEMTPEELRKLKFEEAQARRDSQNYNAGTNKIRDVIARSKTSQAIDDWALNFDLGDMFDRFKKD